MSSARAKLLSVLPTILAAALSFNEPARAFIPEGSWVAYAICAGNLPGGKLNDGVPHSNEEVIEACTEVLNTQNRENYRLIALSSRGEAYQRLGKDLQAIENFNELLRLYPRDASGTVHALRAESYTRLGTIELAIADYTFAVGRNPTSNGFLTLRGVLYNIQKQPDRAIADFNLAIHHIDTWALSYEGRCLSYTMKRNFTLALSDCNKAIKLDPKSAQAYETRSKLYSLSGQQASAAADLAAAAGLRNEIMVTAFEISYDAPAPDILQWFAKLRVSEQGQAITKAVCAYYDVPPEVVDFSTKEIWMKQVQNSDAGNEHHGSLSSPPGYGICEAHRLSETSITGPSSLSVGIVRKRSVGGLDGLAWYAAVPTPDGLGRSDNWARAVWQVTFVKSDPVIWNKHKAKCGPPDYVVPAHYVLEDCTGKDCKGPYRHD